MFATPVDPLLQSIRAGDTRTFERLFHADYRGLCSFADRMVASPEVAEELVQSVFLRLWSGRRELQGIRSLRAYLYKATRNAALDHLKHEAHESRWAAAVAAAGDEAAGAAGPDPEQALDDVLRARTLHEAIARLSPRARQVVELRWLQGMTHPEVAEALGISVKGVEIQVTRALRVLRALLGVGEPPA